MSICLYQMYYYDLLGKKLTEVTFCYSRKETKVRFHQSSVMSAAPNVLGSNTHQKAVGQLPTDWLVYEEMTRAHR